MRFNLLNIQIAILNFGSMFDQRKPFVAWTGPFLMWYLCCKSNMNTCIITLFFQNRFCSLKNWEQYYPGGW